MCGLRRLMQVITEETSCKYMFIYIYVVFHFMVIFLYIYITEGYGNVGNCTSYLYIVLSILYRNFYIEILDQMIAVSNCDRQVAMGRFFLFTDD